ncbi:hypothetical protein FRC11_003877, partial [Ceratobasidium sp. 423]
MVIQPSGYSVEIPPEATAQQEGPFFGIHSGIITGVYNSNGWPFVHNLLKSSVARKFVDPVFGQFTSWNATVWFRKTGVKLNDDVFSALYPHGTTIIHHDSDEIVPYTGRESRVNEVLMMARAFAEDEGAGLDDGPDPPPGASPPPPTIANMGSCPPSPLPPTWTSYSGNDTWVYQQSTYIASLTIAMSSPEHSPERLPTAKNLPQGSQPHPSSQASTTSTLQFPSSQEAGSQLQLVIREARHRMRALVKMHHQDSAVESQICTEVILQLLTS